MIEQQWCEGGPYEMEWLNSDKVNPRDTELSLDFRVMANSQKVVKT